MSGFPFKNLVVIELASVLAGPSVGMFFAELGAKVIKIENPDLGGDVTRKWLANGESSEDGISAYFSAVNWGKQSIALNLRDSEDKAILLKMISKADLVISSFKAGDEAKLGLESEKLLANNSKLIHASITAYGPKDPRVGFDALLQAEAGFMYMNGSPDGPPVKMPVALIDVLAAHQLKEAILVALLDRERSGKGKAVTVSLFQAAVSSLVNQATNWLVAGVIPQRMGSEHPNIAPYGTLLKTKDEKWLLLAIGNDKQFAALCKVLEAENEAQKPEFKDNVARVKHRDQLNKMLKNRVPGYDLEPLLEQLGREKVPAGQIRSMKEVFDQPEAQAILLDGPRGERTIHGVKGFVGQVGEDLKLSPPPVLDQHREDILKWLGGSNE